METLFWIGQADWLAFLVCGAYLLFCFRKLSDEEDKRKTELERRDVERSRPTDPSHSYILHTLD